MSEDEKSEGLITVGQSDYDVEDLMGVVEGFARKRSIPNDILSEILGVVTARQRLYQLLDCRIAKEEG